MTNWRSEGKVWDMHRPPVIDAYYDVELWRTRFVYCLRVESSYQLLTKTIIFISNTHFCICTKSDTFFVWGEEKHTSFFLVFHGYKALSDRLKTNLQTPQLLHKIYIVAHTVLQFAIVNLHASLGRRVDDRNKCFDFISDCRRAL